MSGSVSTSFVDFGAPLHAADLNNAFAEAVSVSALAANTNAALGASLVGYSGRTVQARLADVVSVADYGADPSGVSSSFAAFQAAINATPTSGMQVVHVPRGRYSGGLGGLSLGGRVVCWTEEGTVVYVGGAPPGARAFTNYDNDTSRPWFYQALGVGFDDATGVGTVPLLRLQKTSAFTGGPAAAVYGVLSVYDRVGGGYAEALAAAVAQGATALTFATDLTTVLATGMPVSGSGIAAGTTIAATPTIANGVTTVTLSQPTLLPIAQGLTINLGGSAQAPSETVGGIVYDWYNTETTGKPEAVGLQIAANFRQAGSAFGFATNFVCSDWTGLKSSSSNNTMNNEFDLVRSGPDDADICTVLTLALHERSPSADGPTSFYCGLLVRPAGFGGITGFLPTGPSTIKNGVLCSTVGMATQHGLYGNFIDAFACDGGAQNGVHLFSGSHTFITAAASASGATTLSFYNGLGINVGQQVSGPAGVATGTTVTAVTMTGSNTVVTISSPLTAAVNTGSPTTFTATYNDGVRLDGVYADAAIAVAAAGQTGLVKLGSTLSAAGAVVGEVQFVGQNLAASAVAFSAVQTSIVSASAGAETGTISISASHNGTMVQEMVLGGGVGLGAASAPKGGGSLNLGSVLYVAGTQVVGARNTGWTAGTYSAVTPLKGAIDYDTATLAQLAGRVLALEQALFAATGHGLIGT